jgi:dTDP-4-dehydrorhamnose 3,5-epimerase
LTFLCVLCVLCGEILTVNVTKTPIPDVLILEPKLYSDARGFFFESFNCREMERAGLPGEFVQDNQSHSLRHVLRGLHYQIRQPQGKLVRVVAGEVFDVAVDVRESSPTFGKWVSEVLSAENRRQMWVPPGFAHGFLVLSDAADVAYKVTEYYAPEHERTLLWNDPAVAIPWPCEKPILSAKDAGGVRLATAEVYP